MKIACNSGHFIGIDPGAVNQTTLLEEANVNKVITTALCEYLRVSGHEVLYISDNELDNITTQSNQFSADLFISVHCNSFSNSSAQGTESWCYKFGGEGEKLANFINKEIVDSLTIVNRGIKEGNFYVLKHTDCPAVLVECAFISNTHDEKLLSNSFDQKLFAHSIYLGIQKYIKESNQGG